MEVLVKSNWITLTLIEDSVDLENQDPEEVTEGSSLPDGSGTPEPTIDPDFEEVSNMILEKESDEEIKEEKNNSSETSKGEEKNDTRSVEEADITSNLEGISVQLGVIDVCCVLCLLLYIFKQFIRVPR